MIEIREAIIASKKAPKEAISFSYDKGSLNIIDYSEKYKFDFLKLKDQSLDKGEFYIDDIKIYPNEDNENSIFFLAVNSLIKIGLCFVVKKEEKKQKVQDVQSKLIELRTLPTDTEEQKQDKIVKILNTSCDLKPSYLLIDYNDETNKSVNLSFTFLEPYAVETNVIVLSKASEVINELPELKSEKKKRGQKVETETSIAIGEETIMVTEKVEQTTEKDHIADDFIIFDLDNGNNFFKFMWNSFKKNVSVFLSFGVPVIGVISFSLLSPMYARGDNKWLLIPFILTIVVCFVLHLIMTYKCTSYLTNKNDADRVYKMLSYLFINAIVTLLAAAIGVGIYLLFKNFDANFKTQPFNKLDLILPIILGLIMVTENLYIAYLGNLIVNLFKKKKK